MNDTQTINPPTDAVGTDAVPDPGGPGPQPGRSPALEITIPDGDPAAGALALLAAGRPDAGSGPRPAEGPLAEPTLTGDRRSG
jgi:hypothetical protein